jgi:hypothetical protein
MDSKYACVALLKEHREKTINRYKINNKINKKIAQRS